VRAFDPEGPIHPIRRTAKGVQLVMTERAFWVLALGLSGAIGVGVMLQLRNADVARLPNAGNETTVPQVDVARMLRTLQLVTVTIDTKIDSASTDESWRGDVSAMVSAPVRYFYAVDLSGLTSGSISREPVTGAMSIKVPPPKRLAVEVFSAGATSDVRVGGTRLRDVAGEYHLGLARAALHHRAREAVLTKADQERLEAITRSQIADLVRVMLGDGATVSVDLIEPVAPSSKE
jgi:uncharacterized lipoprotein YmbA